MPRLCPPACSENTASSDAGGGHHYLGACFHLRRFKRGFDQSQLLANALGAELNCPVVSTLKKVRNNPPQSGIQEKAARKANVMGVYRVRNPECIRDKSLLLIDDVVTSGSTASECARILMTAGAREISFAAVAATSHENNNKKM